MQQALSFLPKLLTRSILKSYIPPSRRRQEMGIVHLLGILVFVDTLSSVLCCGGGSGPQPCSYSTCSHEWRNDWSPGISTGRCVGQHRNAHFKYTSHSGSSPCPASRQCNPATQRRTMCEQYRTQLSFVLGLVHANAMEAALVRFLPK